MRDELTAFQQRAKEQLRHHCAAAHNEYRLAGQNQVVSFTAPTGAGKTIVMASLIEDILHGTEQYVEQPEAIFVWLSDSPELNQQSKEKIETRADKIGLHRCVVISDESFDRETLEEGHIYFLNTQKLGKASNLTHHSDSRQYTIWETLANTIADKPDRLYFIIDEAHRGMKGSDAGRATTIMQKFILGSEKEGLPPVPVVIGMSATIERFNQLVKNSTATNRPVRVSPEEVRQSGLLKDRVIIYYPKEADEQKDMAVLQAATDEWLRKCRHWELFCKEQHHWMVKPVFVVQVLNGVKAGGTGNSGSSGKSGDSGDSGNSGKSGKSGGSGNSGLSATDLDECLARIESRAGTKFAKGEVVHSFGDTKGGLVINGLEVPYLEPSRIQDDQRVRVVFFKETLSTGWDCPRAETMMSFRRYVDSTAIAQLLGRMVRTPIHQRVMVDDMLNDVQLFLPHFDAEKVKTVVDELQNEEGGELPTDVIGDELERGEYKWLTAKQPIRRPAHRGDNAGPTLFDLPEKPEIPGSQEKPEKPETAEKPDKPETAGETPAYQPEKPEHPENPERPERPENPATPELPLEIPGEVDRGRVIDFINGLALPSYQVRRYQQNNYLVSLFALGRFLLLSGLDTGARGKIVDAIVERISNYVAGLKLTGSYSRLREEVQNFEMLANVYDPFGEQLKATPVKNLFSETSVDMERQLRIADKQLCGEGVAVAYGKRHATADDWDGWKVDVILYVCDAEQLRQLHDWAKGEYHRLNDRYRQKTVRLNDTQRTQYRNITRDSAEVSETPFSLGRNVLFRSDGEGEEYSDHLYGDEQTGTARIKLNGWEKRVIDEERQREDFRCWYRNPSRGSDALALCHEYKGVKRLFYPDFLIVRREADGDYALDLLEPHDPTRDDNVSKAKALAQYATENPSIGRAQLIRLAKTATGEELRRLDFAAHSELRERVAVIGSNEELDRLFAQYGQ